MPAGIGVELRPVEPNRAKLQNPHLARQNQTLDEQLLDVAQKPAPERRDRVVIWIFIRGHTAERHSVICGAFELPA